ncbi:ComEA family DNA-binding protein [Candidatus Spongiihabitans sp.]|uniref:ComEA family DNA-binding protein n=1 Tax=Candidatus Spongiihabitans sp. TaxID=3101308 RepID=UPI003C7CA565
MQTMRQRAQVGQSGIRFFMRFFLQFFQGAAMAMAIGMFAVAGAAENTAEKVNLNLADAETLEYIPGIGPVKAADIIALRQQNGGFKSFEDLLEVRGIGAKTLEDIKKYGSLNDGVSKISPAMRDNPPSEKMTATDSNQNQASG